MYRRILMKRSANPSPAHGDTNESGRLQGPEYRVHGLIRTWLLLLLAEQENHGYELVRRLKLDLPESMLPDPGVIYRILREMEKDGAVTASIRSGGGGPARKVYTITDGGTLQLKRWRDVAGERIGILSEFLRRLTTVIPDSP